MACLLIAYDAGNAPLVDLAASITGYHVQFDSDELINEAQEKTIIALERNRVAILISHVVSLKQSGRPILGINLRCLDKTATQDDGGWDDDMFDHEYLFLREKFQRKDFCRFLSFITGQSGSFSKIKTKERSVYIGLTYPDVRVALSNMAIVSVGADALELRVDLLQDQNDADALPPLDYVAEQLTLLRLHSELPIIFTIRLESSGGRWPLESTRLAAKYLKKALQWGVEFIDVEDNFEEEVRGSLLSHKKHTRIIASHHDFSGLLDWTSPSTMDIYKTCASFGDVVQIAGIATDLSNTFEVQRFRSKVKELTDPSQCPPLSAFNTGKGGKLSRILNPFLNAMTHPLLPVSSAPNQLSLVEANGVLSVLGETTAKKIYLFGDPDSNKALMDKCFNELNLPHQVVQMSKDAKPDVKSILKGAECGGAVFEGLCLARDQLALELGDDISHGLLDTVSVEDGKLSHHNCLSDGMRSLLTQEHSPSAIRGQDVLVIGRSFAQASPVVSALISLECGHIFTLGFSVPPTTTTRATTCTATEFDHAFNCVGIFSTLATKDRSFLGPLLGLINKKQGKSATRSMIYLDMHGSQKDHVAIAARASGWCTIMKENISAAVLAARLRVLVDQSIPYDFIRMVRRQQLY